MAHRKVAINITNVLRGGPRPWKKRNNPIVVHASQKGAAMRDVDFDSLDLAFKVDQSVPVVIPKTHWTAPPSSLPNLPFAVDRTEVGASLPVYTEFKGGRTKIVTILRKCRGDISSLKRDMEKIVGKPVAVRPGKLVVDGNYHIVLKKWLAGLGF